jgi:hypothetical protein
MARHNAAILARQNDYRGVANEKKIIRKEASQRQITYQVSLDASEIEGLLADTRGIYIYSA